MLGHVALVITDVSEELRASIIRVTRIGGLGTMLGITSTRVLVTANVPSSPNLGHSDDGGAKFLRNVGSYEIHTA
jgi:hypothetical protein